MAKAIWKFGPSEDGESLKVLGRPVSFGVQHGDLYVWCEVDASWHDLPNTKKSDALVDWKTLLFVGTNMSWNGTYLGTVHATPSDGYPHVWHGIEVE